MYSKERTTTVIGKCCQRFHGSRATCDDLRETESRYIYSRVSGHNPERVSYHNFASINLFSRACCAREFVSIQNGGPPPVTFFEQSNVSLGYSFLFEVSDFIQGMQAFCQCIYIL